MNLPSSPHGLARPRRNRNLGGVLLLLALGPALSGCSGTRFGDALSRSFSTPPASTSRPSSAPETAPGANEGTAARQATGAGSPPATRTPAAAGLPTNLKASGAPGAPQAGGTAAPGTTATAAGGAPKANPSRPAPLSPSTAAPGSPATPAAGPTSAPARPAPYRVTILLPEADAAAPAEVVTRALRSAGVPFEVETIERIGRTPPSQTPVSRQAPPPR